MKQRLDQAVVARGLVGSRSQAESWIRLGKVEVGGRVVTKPGFLVAEDAVITLQAAEQYVNRAALKLASVAQALHIDFTDKTVLDVGSSTGGFTDYALRHGARKVIAIDVGTNQLHPSLRGNPKIELHEQTDIRDVQLAPKNHAPLGHAGVAPMGGPPPHGTLVSTVGEVLGDRTPATKQISGAERPISTAQTLQERKTVSKETILSEIPDIVVIDVSFISLRDILPHIATLSSKNTLILAMAKPQFEASATNQKHKGVIKNDRLRRDILKSFEDWARQYFIVTNKADSDIPGAKGNLERFYTLRSLQHEKD